MPPLRERREDIPALVRHLSRATGRASACRRGLTAGTLQALERHDWPGNIRELENVLQQGIILARDGVLDLCGFEGEPIDAIEAPRLEATQVRTK